LGALPFVGRAVVTGDLAVPLSWQAALVVAGLSLACALAILLQAGRDRLPTGRPLGTGRRPPSRLRFVPLAVSVLAFWGATRSTRQGADLNSIGFLLTTTGTVLIVPTVVRSVGAALAVGRPVSAAVPVERCSGSPSGLPGPFSAWRRW
jgi:hypothetical protein